MLPRHVIWIALAVGCGAEELSPRNTTLGEDALPAEVADFAISSDGGLSRADAATDMTSLFGTCDNIVGTRAQQVCLRWNCDRMDRSEGSWTGSVTSCNPGDISALGRKNALKLLNLYRFLADLPEVTTDPLRDSQAQACALIMDANDALSHDPPATWKCYQSLGAIAAGKSNLSPGPGVMSVELYMNDRENESTLGHRRWILSNSLGPVGLGSTDDGSCMHVVGGSGNAGRLWVAWPPPGPFPAGALTAGGFGDSLDKTGWSLQSGTINLEGAQVTISDNGQNRPVLTSALGQDYGAKYAIRWIPSGWTTQAGHSYKVSVTPKLGNTISYTVDVLGCP